MKSELETCLDKKTRGWVNLFSYLIIPLTIFLIHFNTPAQTFVIGTGTQVNTSTGYPAPYGNSYSAAKHQILYKNYELVASGLTAGEIHKFGFNVANLNNSAVLNDFYISMKNTTTEALNSWETDLITEPEPGIHHRPQVLRGNGPQTRHPTELAKRIHQAYVCPPAGIRHRPNHHHQRRSL